METKQIGPDGEPAVFDSGVWYSSDGRYQWDGADWVRSHRAGSGLSFAHVGFAGMFIAVIAYAAYTLVNASNSAFNVGFYLGAVAFFGVLFAVFLVAGRWGWIGALVRVLCVGLALLKLTTLIFSAPGV
jgi:hypothetical protein